MINMSQNRVYVNMMRDTLKRKKEILLILLNETRQQEQMLKSDEIDEKMFTSIIEDKGLQIDELNKMDEGFDTLFKYVEREIESNRFAYKEEIQEMQKLIAEVSELGVQVQALEHQNAAHFKVYLANQKKIIREFHLNKKTSSSYYQNMLNSHKAEQSYFFDQIK